MKRLAHRGMLWTHYFPLPSSSSRLGSRLPRPQQEQFVMLCSSRLERLPCGSDFRMSSQDGKGRKRKAVSSWPSSQLVCSLEYWCPYGLSLPRRRKSALFSPVILIAAWFYLFWVLRLCKGGLDKPELISGTCGSPLSYRGNSPIPLSSVS